MRKFFKMLLNLAGTVGERLKYGAESNNTCYVGLIASAVVKAKSGRFVTLDSSGYASIATIGSGSIFGSLEGGYDVTASATAGVTKMMCNVNPSTLYRIPINSGTYANTLRGTHVDLSVASSIQGVAIGTTAKGHVIIIDGDVANQKWVIVKPNAILNSLQGKSAA